VGIKRLNREERLLEVNDRQCDILGYSRDELLQLSLADFTHAEDLPHEREELARLMAREIPCFSIEKRCLRKDGEVIWVRVTSSLPAGADRPAPWWMSVVEEITQRKRADEALRQTTAELARSNQDLEQFAYVASHDLQEPLRMVAGYLQLLSDRYRGRLDEKADKFIAYAVDGAERMSVLIRDLLAYSRVDSRSEQLLKTSAEEALCFALKNLASSIEESGAAIHYGPLPMVRADKAQLRQLFQNLVGNAVKFRSPDRPAEIQVSSQQDARHWLFTVRDNGIGFDEKYQDKIFLIFQRLQSRGKYPGTGIGLAICKRIVERHGGAIWATSQPGRGSAFHFTIPIEGAS
jgi:PAS domain S-box-containing protein